jgi:hypothetical protein
MRPIKNENSFQHNKIKYIAVDLPPNRICDDCSFFVYGSENTKPSCGMPKKISCLGSERKDGRYIKWLPKTKKETLKCQKEKQ